MKAQETRVGGRHAMREREFEVDVIERWEPPKYGGPLVERLSATSLMAVAQMMQWIRVRA